MIELNSVLLVSSSVKGLEMLAGFLKTSNAGQFSTAQNGAAARRLLAGCDFDLVVINSPLSDELGDELAEFVTSGTLSGVILIVKNDYSDEIASKVEECGVLVLPKPFSRQSFFQQLHLAIASRMRLMRLHRENEKLKRKISEMKIIDRAKCLLIQHEGMSEEDAHRYIEKYSMNNRMTRGETARAIAEQYEGCLT